MSGPELLRVSDLRVAYGGIPAVRGVDLSVPRGAIVAVVGANGAGKTSLLRGIMGMERSGGTVIFEGRPISRYPSWKVARRGIAHVPQGRRLYPQMTVDENLALGAYVSRDLSAKQEVFALFPRLEERRTQPVGYLSGGEQQMLALGRALMARPKLIALDEPSFGLAPIVVTDLFRTIRRIAEGGVSVLLAEQNATQALAVGEFVYVVDKGRVVYEAPSNQAAAEVDLFATYIT